MVRVTDDLALSPEALSLYHASDPLLGHLPVLIFHGPSTTANYTLNTSRVQIHVLSPAGFQSFPRITISPSSPFYGAVGHLPREIAVDEVYRGLAFGLFKYFTELPDGVKTYLKNAYPTRGKRPGSGPTLFGEQHAAELVKSMTKSDNAADVIASLEEALQTQHVSNVDVDLVLPPGAIVPLQQSDLEDMPDDEDDILDPTLRQYGGYTPLIKLFGEPLFLPTSRLRRAPSKPTSLNRSKSFTKEQRAELRLKLAEVVDTEERYVSKLRELVQGVAHDFRESARNRPSESTSPSEEDLERLFPPSADEIYRLNSQFVLQLRAILDETEPGKSDAHSKDPSGALAISRLFLEWFPKFSEPYQDYIKASQHFPTLLNSFLDQQSSFKQRVHQTGEQAVRSILIEPVQRLPRYSLLIDQIVGSLPITHPALQPMLRARDVITNICSMDEAMPDQPHVASRLRNMVDSWPEDLEPQGRLIAAADFVELTPPFKSAEADAAGILVLFSDCIVILKKIGFNMTGRDLLREIDKPSAAELLICMTNAAGGQPAYEFAFTGWHNLADVRFTESTDGSLIWMTSTQSMKDAHPGEHKVSKTATARCFLLQEAFQSKATKWSEDVVRGRVEGRFSEAEREDPCWTLRSVRMQDSNLGLYVAVFQEGAHELIEGRREPAPIRVVVDHERGTKGAPVGHYGVEVVVNLSANSWKKVSLVTVGVNGKQFQDDVDLEDLLPTLSRRIIQLLSSQFNVGNAALTGPMVSYYTKALRGLSFSTRAEKTRSFLAASPVKLLSNLWNSAAGTVSQDVAKPQQPALHRSNSIHSMLGSIRGNSRPNTADGRPENPLVRLEETFTGFIASLQSRKGAITGRALLNRTMADELAVNDIYNRFIETPFDYRVPSETGTEVIFVAFENFLRIAWTEQMGPVMTMRALNNLVERANKRVPGDFADFVRYLFRDMAPQNRRAFTALIKLLADLLEGCGSDSDRGALTIAFAELLVTDGDAQGYMNLLDRLVEDCDRLFDANHDADEFAAVRPAKAHTGSVTSNTSSLRRKFGLDVLLRQNSKDERPSVWRTLSRHRNPATGESASLSRATGDRTRALDDNSLSKRMHRRALSRDRPALLGAFESPSSNDSSPLDTIGEPTTPSKSVKKKRRSSLSDLKSLMAAATLDDTPEVQPLQATKPAKVNASPRSRIPISPNAALALRQQKENEAAPAIAESKVQEPKKPALSGIPTLKPAARPASRPTSPTRPPKLRLQSPAKLRERLHAEKQVVAEVDASLKTEVSKIGEEIARARPAETASLRELQRKIEAMLGELHAKQAATQNEVDTTLKTAEERAKAIDQLHKEVVAENELLYERFQEELGKILKAVKGKGREDKEELLAKLKEEGDENARLKKENARLKRDLASLRARVDC